MHIIKGLNGLVPVVTTIEQILDPLTQEVIKVIKTLRIFDTKTLREIHSFLLEEIDVQKLNIKNYDLRLTLIQNESVIYFFRRHKFTYRLYKYDFCTRELNPVRQHFKGFDFILQENDIERGIQIRFA